MEHITILGSGGFGLSLALSAYRSGHAVKVWSKFPEELEAIRRDGEHKQKLPGVPILICMHQWSLSIRERAWKPERITP